MSGSDGLLYDPAHAAREAGAAVVDQPIINGPFDEPSRHWDTVNWKTHEQKPPELAETRRPAGYFFNSKGKDGTASLFEEEFIELDCVNEIRNRVRQWCEDGYPNATPVTKRLLEQWRDPTRELRFFFCQLEAVETIIWLTESRATDRQGLTVENADGATVSVDKAHEAFVRYCCKMATGTGKTVVMAMVIAWSVLNKQQFPQDTRFTDAILLVAPGLTVRERLQVLRPTHASNYYDKFEVVPLSLRDVLNRARICIVHRQEMAVRTDEGRRGPPNRGRESDGFGLASTGSNSSSPIRNSAMADAKFM